MSATTSDRIVAHPKYQELLRKRNRFSLLLSVIVLIVCVSFVAFAMDPVAFSARIAEGSAISWGIVIGFSIEVFCFIMTGIYVWRANGEFDAINRALIKETSQ